MAHDGLQCKCGFRQLVKYHYHELGNVVAHKHSQKHGHVLANDYMMELLLIPRSLVVKGLIP